MLPANLQRGRIRAGHSGQALIEALVSILAAGLFVALLVMVGKYQLLAQAVDRSSHTLAFQCAMLPTRCTTKSVHAPWAQRIRQQFFDSAADGLQQTSAWTTRTGQPFLTGGSADVALSLSHPHFGAGVGVLSSGQRSAAGSATHLVSNLAGPARFDLEISAGLVTTFTRADLFASRPGSQGAQDLLAGLPVSISAQSAILSDLWNASKPAGPEPTTVQARVEKGQRLNDWLESAQRVGYAPTIGFIQLMGAISLEDTANQFKYHQIAPDNIPADRIGP